MKKIAMGITVGCLVLILGTTVFAQSNSHGGCSNNIGNHTNNVSNHTNNVSNHSNNSDGHRVDSTSIVQSNSTIGSSNNLHNSNMHTDGNYYNHGYYNLKSNLDNLQTAELITKDESKKINEYIIKEEEIKRLEYKKYTKMTQEEKLKYLQENSKKSSSMIDKLVTAEIITSPKATKIKEYFTNQNQAIHNNNGVHNSTSTHTLGNETHYYNQTNQ